MNSWGGNPRPAPRKGAQSGAPRSAGRIDRSASKAGRSKVRPLHERTQEHRLKPNYGIFLGAKIQFDGVDQGDEPGEEGLVGGMLDVGVERGLIFELHDAAEGVALAARRNVGADVGLEKAGDFSLECGDVCCGFLFLRVGGVGLPLEGEDVEDGGCGVVDCCGIYVGSESGEGGGDCGFLDRGATGEFGHGVSPCSIM